MGGVAGVRVEYIEWAHLVGVWVSVSAGPEKRMGAWEVDKSSRLFGEKGAGTLWQWMTDGVTLTWVPRVRDVVFHKISMGVRGRAERHGKIQTAKALHGSFCQQNLYGS